MRHSLHSNVNIKRKVAFAALMAIAVLILSSLLFGHARPGMTADPARNPDMSVESPRPGSSVGSSIMISGRARGLWFFEASFPIRLLDQSGTEIASGIAEAQGDWMTEGFVNFKADISAPQSYEGPATIVLEKDNPSGMPQHDASVRVPITIKN